MFLGLPDPDPLDRDKDPDPDPAPALDTYPKLVEKVNLVSYYFVTLFDPYL
jgi:hypothetical protein